MKIYEEINIKHCKNNDEYDGYGNDEYGGDGDEDNDNGIMKKMIKIKAIEFAVKHWKILVICRYVTPEISESF